MTLARKVSRLVLIVSCASGACLAALVGAGCTSILGDFTSGDAGAEASARDAGGVEASALADAGGPDAFSGGDGASSTNGDASSLADAADATAPSEASAPDFALTVASPIPGQARVVRGQSGSVVFDVTSVGGFSGAVTVSVAGLPTGVTVDALTVTAGAASGTLAVHAASSSTLGGAVISVTGTSGSLVHTAAFTLVVEDAPGSVDTTFGTMGRVLLPVGAASNDLGPGGITLQSDGSIVICGNAVSATTTIALALARLTPAGVLDPTFGTGGETVVNRAGSTTDVCGSVRVLPSGAIAVGGFTLYSATTGAHAFLAARLTSAGALDTTFGGGTGFVTTPFGTGDAKANGMVPQADGKLVLGGFGGGGVAFARYATDGSLDLSYGPNPTGPLVTTFANAGAASALALQSSGDMVASIQFTTFLVFRYTTLGILDTTFGSGGHVALDVGGQGTSTANYAITQPDDSIVVAGSALVTGGIQGIGIARFGGGGTVDTAFGTGGSVTLSYTGGAAVAHTAALGPDGTIAVAGESFVSGASAFTVARVTANGTVDPVFGTAGRVTFDSGGTGEAIAVDSLGRILVAGRITANGRTNFVVYRIWP